MMASVYFGGWTIPLRAESALLELFGFKDKLRYMTNSFQPYGSIWDHESRRYEEPSAHR
jgi:hypothetical protein